MQIYKNGNRWSVDVFDTNWYSIKEDKLLEEFMGNFKWIEDDFDKRCKHLFNPYLIGYDPYEEGGEGTMTVYKKINTNNPIEVARSTYKITGNESR